MTGGTDQIGRFVGKERKWVTAGELLARLEADPEFVARREADRRADAQKRAALRGAERPLVEELHEIGVNVDTAWDLVNTSHPYPDALPILVEHLGRPYPDRVRAGIARALAVRDARFAWDRLRDLYLAEPVGTATDEALAAALGQACDDSVLEELVELAKDDRRGDERLLLLSGLLRSGTDLARETLRELANHPVFAKELKAIGRTRG
jgi:hypothetical protein